jgi:hypothetical protein
MKIIKSTIGVFLTAFLVGIAVFYLIPKTEENIKRVEIVQTVPLNFSTPKPEAKSEPEILEENNDWEKDFESKFKTKLLETGEGFHGDEINAKNGETWLGLFKKNDKYFLRSTKINIKRVNDPITDNPKEKTGKSVAVSENGNPLFLVKNSNELTDGEVKSSFWMNINDLAEDEYSDASSLKKNFVQEYDFDGTKYILRVKSGINKKGENIIALVLEGDGKSQVIHSLKSFEEGDYLGSVYFAGDLDNDNKPDFYFDLYFHDNTEYKNLFLSSKAKKGKITEKVATFSTTGC